MNPEDLPSAFILVHPQHGRVTVGKQQWLEKGNKTGWDEASARARGFVPEYELADAEAKAKADAELKAADKNGDGKLSAAEKKAAEKAADKK